MVYNTVIYDEDSKKVAMSMHMSRMTCVDGFITKYL